MDYGNLRIIGTSHIAKQSLREVKEAVEDFKPDIIAIELDKRRLAALLSKKDRDVAPKIGDIRRIGLKGYIFALIASWVEHKLGAAVGVSPGSEMMAAVRLAKRNNLLLALIDQDIEVTLRRFSKALTWKEKWSFVVDMFNGFVLRKKEDFGFRLDEVPSKKIIKTLVERVKARYPSLYKVLIEERNAVMAENLHKLMARYSEKKIVAVVGAGHEEEIAGMIRAKKGAVVFSDSFESESLDDKLSY